MIAASRLSVALAFAAFAATAAAPSVARADEPQRAEVLFKEGRAALDGKRYSEACPKLAESQRLDPGAGTLLALALCHEGQGKTATAWRELKEAADLGRKNGRPELANAADKRAAAMEPSLSRLVVRVDDQSEGLRVQRDGEALDPEDFGTGVPVDPGEHKVEASAPGKITRSYVVRLSGAGSVEIVVERLASKAVAAAVAPAPRRSRTPLAPAPVEPAADRNPGSAQRIIGLGLVGVGVVALGAGAYFGGKAITEQREAKRDCPQTPCKDPTVQDTLDRSRSSLNWSIVAVAASAATVGLGAVLYILAPTAAEPPRSSDAKKRSRPTARVTPEAGPTQVGLGVVGTF